MRRADYDATLLVHAVKGRPIKATQYAVVKVGGRPQYVKDGNKDLALAWWGEWAAEKIKAYGWGPKLLVPIPNTSAVVGDRAPYRTLLMAQQAAAKAPGICVVVDALRWRRKLEKSSDSGPRRPELLLPDLVLAAKMPKGDVILVDDVFTSGGHAIACAWRLADSDKAPVCLVACGRTLHAQLDDPFSVADEELAVPPRPS